MGTLALRIVTQAFISSVCPNLHLSYLPSCAFYIYQTSRIIVDCRILYLRSVEVFIPQIMIQQKVVL